MFLVLAKTPKEIGEQEFWINPDHIAMMTRAKSKKGEYAYGIWMSSGMQIPILEETYTKLLDFSESILPKVPTAFHEAWEPTEDDME